MNNYSEFRDFKSCVQDAPEGAYEHAKQLDATIGEACDQLMRDLRALGLRADNCDLIYHVEATIYDYVKKSNPDSTLFIVAEGFGSAMDGRCTCPRHAGASIARTGRDISGQDALALSEQEAAEHGVTCEDCRSEAYR